MVSLRDRVLCVYHASLLLCLVGACAVPLSCCRIAIDDKFVVFSPGIGRCQVCMIAHGFFYSKVWWSVAWMGFIRKFGGRLFGRGRFFAVGVWQFIVQYGRCACFVLVESAIRIRICISTWHAIVFGGGLIFVLGSFIFYVVFVGLFVRCFVVWGCLGVFVFAFVGGLSLERFSLRGVAMVLWARFGVLSFFVGKSLRFCFRRSVSLALAWLFGSHHRGHSEGLSSRDEMVVGKQQGLFFQSVACYVNFI